MILRNIMFGLSFGAFGYALYAALKTPPVDTADGQASDWTAAGDGFLSVAYNFTGGLGMQISLSGLNFIKQQEGFEANVYSDSAGLDTIGYGHKLTPLENYQTISDADATRLLAADVADAENGVNNLVNVPLSQGQFDALVSFVYNVGVGAFKRSTMRKLINAGNYQGAIGQFTLWSKATVKGQKVTIAGLYSRRQREAQLFANA